MHFPVIGECLGWRTTDFEELYGDLGQWTMTKELAQEVSGFIYRVTVRVDEYQNQYWICLDREQTGPWAPDCYNFEILPISTQFPILFGRHYDDMKHLSCSPNFPRASYLDEHTLMYEYSILKFRAWLPNLWTGVARGDLVMIPTLLLFKCIFLCYHAN